MTFENFLKSVIDNNDQSPKVIHIDKIERMQITINITEPTDVNCSSHCYDGNRSYKNDSELASIMKKYYMANS